MDSLLFLSARRLTARYPLPAVPDDLFPVLFRAAFLDRRLQVLQDLVAEWPFSVLNFQQIMGSPELLQDDSNFCIQSVIRAVVEQLRLDLEEPSRDSSQCCLRTLDITGFPDGLSTWSSTVILAEACLEVSKYQRESQKCRAMHHKGCSSAATAVPRSIDIHADFFVNDVSYRVLREALRTRNINLLRLNCRELRAEKFSMDGIMSLLKSLDPSGVRRVDLRFRNLGLTGLSMVLVHLSQFLDLQSLKLQYSNVDIRGATPELLLRIQCLAKELGKLPNLKELNLGFSWLSGNLRKVICELQAPLESLELPFCSLLPDDFAFLSQSFHAPTLKRLDLSGHDFSQTFPQSLQDLLEKVSASLLYLDLMECQLKDSHLDTLLALLHRCSRLRFLRLFGNSFSMVRLKDFLWETTSFPELQLVVYPIPVDCYSTRRYQRNSRWVLVKRLDHERLRATISELGQMLESSGRANVVWTHNPYGHRALDYFSL